MSHAIIYAGESSTSQTVSEVSSKLVHISSGVIVNGVQALENNNLYRIIIPGTYLITVTMGVAVDTGFGFILTVYKNGEPTDFIDTVYTTFSGYGKAAFQAMLDTDVGDIIELYITSTSGEFEATVLSSQVSIRSLKG